LQGKKCESRIYEFRVEGRLDIYWSDWFEGLAMRYKIDEESNLPVTVLIGPILDQSHLHGVLEKISSLNLKLQSVNEVRSKSIQG
jgi:hypothetical protein